MVQAASSGLVDFSEMKFFNKPWQYKLRLLMRTLHRENEKGLKQARHRHSAALLAISGISPEDLGALQERCNDDMHELTNLYRPWASQSKEEREKKEVRSVTDRWQRRWGDLDDPETQKKIEATAEALRRQRVDTEPQSVTGDYFGVYNKETAGSVEEAKR